MGLDPDILSKAPIGAFLTTKHVGRDVKVFAIIESEVRMISMFNTLSTVFFSLSFSCLSAALSICSSSIFTDTLKPAGEVLLKFGAPALGILALVFLGVAIWARMSRGNTWDLIRRESKVRK